MNIDDGKLRRLESELSVEQFEQLKKLLYGEGFEPIPKELEEEAEKELKGRDSTVIDINEKSLLADWAKREREKRAKTNATCKLQDAVTSIKSFKKHNRNRKK